MSEAISRSSLQATVLRRSSRRTSVPLRFREEDIPTEEDAPFEPTSDENNIVEEEDGDSLEADALVQPAGNLAVTPAEPADQQPIAVNNTRNAFKWGSMNGKQEIVAVLMSSYEKIVTWHKNFFDIPRGATGEGLLKEVIRLIRLFNNKTSWEDISILAIYIFLPIMLQSPSAKSKNKDHVRYLKKKAGFMDQWKY